MGFWYWFRVTMMSIGLVLVILTIRGLNRVKKGGEPASRVASMIQGVNICPTRVTRLETPKVQIFQEGMDWYRDSAKQRKVRLDDVAVEKWFSRNCTMTGQKAQSPSKVREALKLYFVNGEPRSLLKSAGGEYEWMGLPFRSFQMDDALKELLQLPTKEPIK